MELGQRRSPLGRELTMHHFVLSNERFQLSALLDRQTSLSKPCFLINGLMWATLKELGTPPVAPEFGKAVVSSNLLN